MGRAWETGWLGGVMQNVKASLSLALLLHNLLCP